MSLIDPLTELQTAIVDRIDSIAIIKTPPGDYSGKIPVHTYSESDPESELIRKMNEVGIGVVVAIDSVGFGSRFCVALIKIDIAENVINNQGGLGTGVHTFLLAWEIASAFFQHQLAGVDWQPVESIELGSMEKFSDGFVKRTLVFKCKTALISKGN